MRGKAKKVQIFQVGYTGFCAKPHGCTQGVYSKHWQGMRAACTELCVYHCSQLDYPAKPNLESTYFGFISDSYDSICFLISQNLESVKTWDNQGTAIFLFRCKGMSHLLIFKDPFLKIKILMLSNFRTCRNDWGVNSKAT